MFDHEEDPLGRLTAAAITHATRQLQALGFVEDGTDAAELIERIRALETLKAVASAAQAHTTVRFAAVREAELLARSLDRNGQSAARQAATRRDVGAQVGLARRVSPRMGTRLTGMAKVLTREMPATMGALRAGVIEEYQAMLVVAETSALSLEHRQVVDAELGRRFGTMTPAQAQGAAAAIGYRLDPEQAVRRARKAAGDRRVTIRPAPDTMTYLTALLPMDQGVSVYAALTRYAATATAVGDPRGRGALMADELVRRLVAATTAGVPEAADVPGAAVTDVPQRDHDDAAEGAEHAEGDDPMTGMPAIPAGVHLEIQLVMTDRTLFDGDAEPAILSGYGPIPAPLARRLINGAAPQTKTWVRRLYTDDGGRITDADSRRRLFTHTARQFLVARDQVCRTPWCGAPIVRADHTRPHALGGPTALANGAGRCAACNQAKEEPGWATRTDPDGSIVTVTPTGHRYRSHPPPAPHSAPWSPSPAWAWSA